MPLAAAVIGSAVVGAGATIYAGSQAKKAASRATDAANQAAAQQLAAQQANFDRINTLNQPFVNTGVAALDRLGAQFGLSPPQTQSGGGGVTTGAPAPQGFSPGGAATAPAPSGPAYPGAPYSTPRTGGQFDGAAYLQGNPDVAAEYDRLNSFDEGRAFLASNNINDANDFGAFHYQKFGRPEGRAEPMTPVTLGQTVTPDLMNAQRPDAPDAPSYARPTDLARPGLPNVDWKSIESDPGFIWETQQAANGTNANFAARGKVRSGDAALALQKNLFGVAHSVGSDYFNRELAKSTLANQQYQYGQSRLDNNFSNDRAYGTALWQNNRDFANNNFNTDRGYQTNRYDTNTANLFNLANVGLAGAGNVSGAGTNLANAQTNIFGSQANAAADAAYAKAQANSQIAGGLAGAANNIFAAWGGGAGAIPWGSGGTTVGQAWNSSLGGGWQTPYAGAVNPYIQPVF